MPRRDKNIIIRHDDGIEVLLSQGQSCIIDKKDWSLIKNYKWHVQATRDGRYYAVASPKFRVRVSMAQLVLGPRPKNMVVDHINGNRLDNRRSNLRYCTRKQNNRNVGKKGVGKFKGATLQNGRWRARIMVNGKAIHLGYFDTDCSAAGAYDRAAVKYFGKFARLNNGAG